MDSSAGHYNTPMPRTPRTRRYIFNTLTVVSLLLMLATAGLWVDSYWKIRTIEDRWTTRKQSRSITFTSCWGTFVLAGSLVKPPQVIQTSMDGWEFTTQEATEIPRGLVALLIYDMDSAFAGFGITWQRKLANGFYKSHLLFPHWFLTLIFAIGPTIWLFKWNNRRKLGANGCPSCAYDLTGNETGVCPECGVGVSADTSN